MKSVPSTALVLLLCFFFKRTQPWGVAFLYGGMVGVCAAYAVLRLENPSPRKVGEVMHRAGEYVETIGSVVSDPVERTPS